ncbi:MAG TPA: PhzF family phenazine biosynthesis protein [Microthrixaceae bacterium]|nr:PhzF family phenazine biosynthesis protein [Microthrixaceae bacterium]
MTTKPFATLDVFCERRFAGNPLAIVEDADGLDDEVMQAVAAEFGLSETVFLQTATREGCDVRARIFTPTTELPFAGHPTIGTALYLVRDGGLLARAATVILDEAAGPVPVVIDPATRVATLTAPARPETGPAPVRVDEAAAMVGLTAGDLDGDPQIASAGNPFLVVKLRTVDAVSRAEPDVAVIREVEDRDPAVPMIFVWAEVSEGVVRARMFAPTRGIAEDPATGSAAAALGAVVAQGLPDGTHRWLVTQGEEMSRPSQLHLAVDVEEGQALVTRVGGSAVVVTTGVIELSDDTSGADR